MGSPGFRWRIVERIEAARPRCGTCRRLPKQANERRTSEQRCDDGLLPGAHVSWSGTQVDEELTRAAAQVAAGDRAAFRAIVEATSARLFRLGARMMGSSADAEDVLQDAYVRAFKALSSGEFDGRSNVGTWLYRIVANGCIDAMRRRKVRPTAAADPPEETYDGREDAEARLALRELDRWLSDLPTDHRAVLILKGVEGLSSSEIARVLECSEGAVEQRLVRARAALRQRRSS